MGRSKEFDETNVLKSAMELFWQKGYEATSMNELLEQMGIHRKSLYDTFGDKRALFLKAIDLYEESNTSKLKSLTRSESSAFRKIQSIFDYIIKFNDETHLGCLLVNAATELGPWDDEVVNKTINSFDQTESFILEIIREGQTSGEINTKYDATTLSEVLHNTLIGLRVQARISISKDKMYRITNFFLDLLKT